MTDFRAGEPLSASKLNEAFETAWDAIPEVSGDVVEKHGGGFDVPPEQPDHGYVMVRNDWLFPIPKFGPIGIDHPILDPSESLSAELVALLGRDGPVMSGTKPVWPRHVHKYGIVQETLGPCEVGKAVVSGTTLARLQKVENYSLGDPMTVYPQLKGKWFHRDNDTITRRQQFHGVQFDSVPFTGGSAFYTKAMALWMGQTFSGVDPHPGAFAPWQDGGQPDCATDSMCQYECKYGRWEVINQTCPNGCSCDTVVESYEAATMPCTHGEQVTVPYCHAQSGNLVAQAMLSNSGKTPVGFEGQTVSSCLFHTCTYECRHESDYWAWVLDANRCTGGCECPNIPNEYACHEGNYAMFNVLSGARAQERREGGRQTPER